MPSSPTSSRIPSNGPQKRLTPLQWLRYGPFLAQVVVTRRCNLDCGYCSEFDKVSDPVPTDVLLERIEKLHSLRCWAVCLTGGEPTLHPDLAVLIREMRSLGIRRCGMITNGLRLTRGLIESLNACGLTDLQI
ncbi:MAG: radical SAM protein, partial [Myxococcota bacterium]